MKNKILSILFPLILSPLVVTSCTILNPSLPSFPQQKPEDINLTFPDYFEKFDKKVYEDRHNLKTKITSIMNKYRLFEWNQYYENNKFSKVLNINLTDYDQKTEGSEDFDWQDIGSFSKISTKLYNLQDKQFQYMNDFINLINEEDTINQEDFLYLRWLYFSLFGANLYQLEVDFPFNENKRTNLTKLLIKNVKITDWIKSIAKVIIEANPNDLFKIIYTFCVYYGVIPNIGEFQKYFEEMSGELKKPAELINKLVKDLSEQLQKIEDELGKNFLDRLEKFYKKIKDVYEQVHGKEINIVEFLKNLKEISNEFQDVSKEFQDVIDKWLNFDGQDILISLLDTFYNSIKDSIPNIKPPHFLEDLKLVGLQNSVLHAQLCSKDMLMRLLSKKDSQDKNYSLWQKKKIRAFNIYKKMVDYSNLLIKSFLVEEDKIAEIISNALFETIEEYFKNLPPNPLKEIMKKTMKKLVDGVLSKIVKSILEPVKKMMESTFNMITNETGFVFINVGNYTDKNLERGNNVKSFIR